MLYIKTRLLPGATSTSLPPIFNLIKLFKPFELFYLLYVKDKKFVLSCDNVALIFNRNETVSIP